MTGGPTPDQLKRLLRVTLDGAGDGVFRATVKEIKAMTRKRSAGKPQRDLPLEAPRLRAYFASALTGLPPDHPMQHVAEIADACCRNVSVELYQPRKKTDPVHNPDVPPYKVFQLDLEQVSLADILILYAGPPSFGAGQELEFARENCIPVIIVKAPGAALSRMVVGAPLEKTIIEYQPGDDLAPRLETALVGYRRIAEARREFLRDVPPIGDTVRRARAAHGGAPNDLLAKAPWVGAAGAQAFDDLSDASYNPSWLQLCSLAHAMDIPVAALVTPVVNDNQREQIITTVTKGLAKIRARAAKRDQEDMALIEGEILDSIDRILRQE